MLCAVCCSSWENWIGAFVSEWNLNRDVVCVVMVVGGDDDDDERLLGVGLLRLGRFGSSHCWL